MKKILLVFIAFVMMSFTSIKVYDTEFTLKHTVTMTNGDKIELYYYRENNTYYLYSPSDIFKYNKSDIDNIKTSEICVTNNIKGDLLYYTKDFTEVIKYMLYIVND